MDPVIRRWWSRIDSLPGRLGAVHRWERGPGIFAAAEVGCLEEFHNVPTAEICLDGSLRLEKPDARVDLQAGDALLIAAGVWHRLQPLRPGALRCALGFLPGRTLVFLQAPDRVWSGLAAIQPCQRLLAAALAEAGAAARRDRLRLLLTNLADEPVAESVFDSQAQWRMVTLLWARARLGLTVDELLAASGLSRTHAYRLFTAGYGMPPKAALEATRLQLAASLLADGAAVREVAERCGFPSADTFRRAWRRRHGRPPGAGRDADRPSPEAPVTWRRDRSPIRPTP